MGDTKVVFSRLSHKTKQGQGVNGALIFGDLCLKMGAFFNGQNLFLRGW